MKTKYQEALDRIKNKVAIIDGEKMKIGTAYCDTLPILQELVDKETPKKVKGYKTILGNNVAGCPHCKGYTMLSCDANSKDYTCYCTHCGGKIDWSDTDVKD